MNVDAIQVQIEKLVLDTRRQAMLAEENRWVRALTELCRGQQEVPVRDIAEMMNHMQDTREAE